MHQSINCFYLHTHHMGCQLQSASVLQKWLSKTLINLHRMEIYHMQTNDQFSAICSSFLTKQHVTQTIHLILPMTSDIWPHPTYPLPASKSTFSLTSRLLICQASGLSLFPNFFFFLILPVLCSFKISFLLFVFNVLLVHLGVLPLCMLLLCFLKTLVFDCRKCIKIHNITTLKWIYKRHRCIIHAQMYTNSQ